MRDIRSEILAKLDEIEQKEQVKVLLAVESGSRSWGVASPDSDYDVRFVYVRKKEEYLRLEEKSDVIEWQLDAVLDINGWDLDKTLKQFHKGNGTLFEWANSSVIYKVTDEWRHIYEVCKDYFSKKVSIHHYCGTAKSAYMKFLQEDMVKYKKYVYALRPLLSCKYIEEKQTIPPVMFEELLQQELDIMVRKAIEEMLEIKAKTDEKDLNPAIPVIQQFIEEKIAYYEKLATEMADDRLADWERLNKVFLQMIEN